jgi:hypothetical protein
MKPSSAPILDPLVQKRLQKMMLAAPVAAAAVSGASVAQGAIVYFDVSPDKTLSGGTGSFDIGNISLSGNGSYSTSAADVRFTTNYSNSEKPRVTTSGIQVATSGTVDEWNVASALSFFSEDTSISASASLNWSSYGYFDSNNGVGTNTDWRNGNPTTGFVGLRIDAGSGNYNYGWAQYVYNDVSNSLTLLDFAFESSVNTAIVAGATAVPEPANTAMLLAAGAAGVAAFRRRRRESAAA